MNNQDIAKSEAGLPTEMPATWGNEAVPTVDVLLPRILLMQGLSDFVADKKAEAGDLVDSTSGRVLLSAKDAAAGKRLAVIPISMFKTTVIEKLVKNKWIYVRVQPYAAGDEKNLWEFSENGEQMRGSVSLNYYVLLADEATNADALPYLISFRRFSTKAGRVISTHFMKCNMAKVPPASKTILVGSKVESNKDGDEFQAFDVIEGERTATPQITAAYKWFQTISQGLARAADEHESENTSAGSKDSGGPAF